MKKMEKAMYVVKMMAAVIEDAKEKFFNENKEEFNNKIFFNIYDDQDEEEILITLMVSSYDSKHKHLVSNWMYNSHDYVSDMKSKKIETLCDVVGLDMPHFTWGNEDFIHKMRYIQILEREDVKHLDAPIPYILCKEKGYEYDLFGKKVYPVEKAWVYWKKGGEN